MSGRIVHLIDTGGPGGAETVFASLVDGLDDRGWSSVPVVPRRGWLENAIRALGHEARREETTGSFDVGYLTRLVRLLRSERADLVQTHLLGTSLYGGLAGRLCGVPVVATFHGSVDVSPSDRFLKAKLRILDWSASRIVFVSHSLRDEVRQRTGFRSQKSVVIPNGVEVRRFTAVKPNGDLRREAGAGPNDVLVGAVGNVRPAKDYRLLLRAAALLQEDPITYRFVVVGEGHGGLLDELLSIRANLGLEETVTFTGFRSDVPQVLSELDIYLLTSSSEGFSLSTVQALAAGLPVVATRCGGPEEIVDHGKQGWLVKAGSPEAVAEGIRHMARHPATARRLGEAGRELVRREYSLDSMIERYEMLYSRCLAL